MGKIKLATIWLDGCSGCHMSLLDIDELLLELADKIDLVYGPLVDHKELPEQVDVFLVEGAVSNQADREHLLALRQRSTTLVAFGDCAITANVPGMRNRFTVEEILARVYGENADTTYPQPAEAGNGGIPTLQGVPKLCRRARPVHEFVPVDIFLPGCPPPAAAIAHLVGELLAGRVPDLTGATRFGA